MELIDNSKTKREDKRDDGRLKWLRKSRSKIKILANSNKQETIRQSKTTNRIN